VGNPPCDLTLTLANQDMVQQRKSSSMDSTTDMNTLMSCRQIRVGKSPKRGLVFRSREARLCDELHARRYLLSADTSIADTWICVGESFLDAIVFEIERAKGDGDWETREIMVWKICSQIQTPIPREVSDIFSLRRSK